MLSRSLHTAFTAAVLLSLAACGAAPESAAPRARIELPKFEVARSADPASADWPGVVEAVRQATLSAETGGRVSAIHVDVDDQVKAGQLLVELAGIEQRAAVDSARAALNAAQAVLDEAERTLKRQKDLYERHLVAVAVRDQAQAARDTAAAQRAAAAAQLREAERQLSYTRISAPYDAVVGSREVEVGESVGAGQALLQLHAPESLRVSVPLPQSLASSLDPSTGAWLLDSRGQRVPSQSVTVFPNADPRTHSITVRVELGSAGKSGLRPGDAVKVAFPGLAGESAIRIPSNALHQRGELSAVFVWRDGKVYLRQLRLGKIQGDQVEVIAGLSVGEQVVSDPEAALNALVAQRAAERGHE